MNFPRLLAAGCAAAVLFVGTSAFAVGAKDGGLKDSPAPVEVMRPEVFSWRGIYFGGARGGAWSSVEHAVTFANGRSETLKFNPPSGVGGIQAGLQGQWGNFVFGLEASLIGGSFAQKKHVTAADNLTEITDMDWMFMLTPRAGYAVDNLLLYVKGGYASAEIQTGTALASSGFLVSGTNRREDGWVIGGGFEYALGRWIVLGVDYSYVRIDPRHSASPQFVANGFAPHNANARNIEAHVIMTRVNFLLGKP